MRREEREVSASKKEEKKNSFPPSPPPPPPHLDAVPPGLPQVLPTGHVRVDLRLGKLGEPNQRRLGKRRRLFLFGFVFVFSSSPSPSSSREQNQRDPCADPVLPAREPPQHFFPLEPAVGLRGLLQDQGVDLDHGVGSDDEDALRRSSTASVFCFCFFLFSLLRDRRRDLSGLGRGRRPGVARPVRRLGQVLGEQAGPDVELGDAQLPEELGPARGGRREHDLGRGGERGAESVEDHFVSLWCFLSLSLRFWTI